MQKIALLLPNIRSSFNVGSIFRSAEIFGVSEIIISGYTPYPQQENDNRIPHLARKINQQIAKTALGTEKIVPFKYFADTDQAIIYASNNGYQIVGLEQHQAAVPLNKFMPAGKVAFIVGEEVDGLPPEIISHCSEIVEIPQIGSKESLNVASAVAILLYDICIGKQK